MAWTTLTFPYGSLLTSTKMTQMQDNFTAFANKDSGAPVLANSYVVEAMLAASAVTEAKIAASAVSSGKLKTTYGDVSVTGTTATNVTLPGGSHGFYAPTWNSAGYSVSATIASVLTVNSPVTNINLYSNSVNSIAYARQYYVQASPPYDLGDGEIPLFVFAVMNPDGTIHSTYIAPEAPWHHNGPTSIRPDVEIGGKKFQRRRAIIAEFGSIKAALLSGLTRAQVMDRMATDPMVDREITQAVKQADMPLIPHPFLGNNLTGKTVVLLDPVSPLMARLLDLHDSGESVTEIVRDWMGIGNTALVRSGPPGVMIVNAALK